MRTVSRRSDLLLLFSLFVVGAGGCSAIKPVICSVTYPVRVFQSRLERAVDDENEDDEDYNDLPAAFVIPTAIVLAPFHFAAASVTGVVAGTASGVASDLNVLVGNADFDWDDMNIHRPFKTNAKRPPDS